MQKILTSVKTHAGQTLPFDKKEINEEKKPLELPKEEKEISPEEMYRLGNSYLYGEGVPRIEDEAFQWFRKAAELGNADAQCSLGFCYENSIGVYKDKKEAMKWYQKAADQGHEVAQELLIHLRMFLH